MGEYRASTLKTTLATIRNTPSAVEGLRLVEPEIIASIDGAPRTGWLPASQGVALNRAMLEHGGSDLVVVINRDITRSSVEMPLFKPLIQGAITLFGGGPKGLLSSFAGAVRLAARGVGVPVVDKSVGAKAARVRWPDLPPELRNHAWSWTVTGSLIGIFDLAKTQGTCVPKQDELSDGIEVFELEWE